MPETTLITIKNILRNLERQHKIKILFAVESGSRAWKMESADSDYDIRFVYYRPLKDYISISPKEQVINTAFDEKLNPCTAHDALYDLSGFDIFKFLHLLKKSNPSTIEWLISEIVYLGSVPAELRAYAEKRFDRGTLIRHYRSMAVNDRHEMEKHQTFTGKKYLYAFRGLLNAFYVKEYNQVPDQNFLRTLESCRQETGEQLYIALSNLIESKKHGQEKDNIGRLPIFEDTIDKFMLLTETNADRQNSAEENELFLNAYLQKLLLGETA